MIRNLVVTSSAQVVLDHTTIDRKDELVADAVAGERKRLEAYLYSNSTLVALVAGDIQETGGSTRSHGEFTRILRVTVRALVTVEGPDAPAARFSADYQGGRLQSGSFGVIDYVEDEQAAREHVGIVDEPEQGPTLQVALLEAASILEAEEVQYALGLDRDHLEHSYVTENGVQRPRTQADLDRELARHQKIADLLRIAADILKES